MLGMESGDSKSLESDIQHIVSILKRLLRNMLSIGSEDEAVGDAAIDEILSIIKRIMKLIISSLSEDDDGPLDDQDHSRDATYLFKHVLDTLITLPTVERTETSMGKKWYEHYFERVKVPGTPRSVPLLRLGLVASTLIASHQPSDCLVLTKEHIQEQKVRTYLVLCFTGEPPTDELELHEVVCHLLETYLPTALFVRIPKQMAKFSQSCLTELPAGLCYNSKWDREDAVISFKRCTDKLLKTSTRYVNGYVSIDDIEHCIVQTSLHLAGHLALKFTNDARLTESMRCLQAVYHFMKTHRPLKCSTNIPRGQEMDMLQDERGIHMQGTTLYTYDWSHQGCLTLTRWGKHVALVTDEKTSRSVALWEDTRRKTWNILCSQPSDAMVIHRKRATDMYGKQLSLNLNCVVEKEMVDESVCEPDEVWVSAVQHILQTLRPERCVVTVPCTPKWMESLLGIKCDSGQCYVGQWREKERDLSFERYNRNTQLLKVPDSHRSVVIARDQDHRVKILTSQPSDCMVLLEHDIKHTDDISVEFICTQQKTFDTEDPTSNEDHQRAIMHLLNKFSPSTCTFRIPDASKWFRMSLEVKGNDGVSFQGEWDEERNNLTFTRDQPDRIIIPKVRMQDRLTKTEQKTD